MSPHASGPPSAAVARITLVVVGVLLALYGLWLVRGVLMLVFIAAFLALAFGPLVDRFCRRGLPRAAAILATYLVILLGVVAVGTIVVPPMVDGVDQLSRDVPGYVDDLRSSKQFREYDNRYHITEKVNDQVRRLPTRLDDATGALAAVTVGVFSTLVQLVTVLSMTFFMLLNGRGLVDFLLRQLGPREPRYRMLADDIYRSVSGYVAGNLLISLIAGSVTWLTLTLLGVPFAVPLAVLMAFLDLIPLIGATIGSVLIAAVAAFHDFPTALIVWGVVAIAYQQVENNILQPLIYRRTVDVPPLAVIVAILVGSSLLGVLGALLAIPLAAAVQIVARDWWSRRGHSDAVVPGDPLEHRVERVPVPG